jgi:D-alanine-D-alanine ligase
MKKNIALVTGGYSGESVISYKSAATINSHLDKEKYDIYIIDITKEGWYYVENNGVKIFVDKNDFSITINTAHIKFDAVLIGMHGTPGEDGKLQGYFDMIGLPYTGCDAATSAITFNKRYGVAVAKMSGIAVAPSAHIFKHTPYSVETILQNLKLPVFVKPNNGGSSIGMSKVSEADKLGAAIEMAFREDDQVLIEEMIVGREFTIGVYKSKGKIHVLPITEVRANDNKVFFDFEAKYNGHSTEITPAQIPDDVAEKIRTNARKVYEVFNCKGVVRIDFIYHEPSATPYMLEVNTVPGQSAASIVPQQVKAEGGILKDFYSLLLDECFN